MYAEVTAGVRYVPELSSTEVTFILLAPSRWQRCRELPDVLHREADPRRQSQEQCEHARQQEGKDNRGHPDLRVRVV